VHRRHLSNPAIRSKDHAERNVHRSHVDVDAIGAPAVAIMQIRLEPLRGLRLGQSNPVDLVAPIPVPAEAHRAGAVTGGTDVTHRFGDRTK
jgi:hypothetical protein